MALLDKVLVRKPKHSNFNLGQKVRTTMAPGLLYPIIVEDVVPGDSFSFDLSAVIKTYPTLAPIMGSFKLQFDYFFCPWRLYVKRFRDNRAGFADLEDIAFPYIAAPEQSTVANPKPADVKGVVAAGSLMNFLGIPAGWYNSTPADPDAGFVASFDTGRFSAFPFLSYIDIYRNYYVNPQEADYAQMSSSGRFMYKRSDWAQRTLLRHLSSLIDDVVAQESGINVMAQLYKKWSSDTTGIVEKSWKEFSESPLSGLFCRTYLPDHFTSWVDTVSYESIQNKTRMMIGGSDGNQYITVDQMRYASKLAQYLEKGLLVGDRYGDMIRAQFGVSPDRELDIPAYLGGTSTDLIFEDVVSNAETSGTGNGPLGSLAGRGMGFLGSKRRRYNFSEYGTFMVIASLVPRVDYYQGIPRRNRKLYLSDVFNPDLDAIGMQDLLLDEVYANPNSGLFEWSDTDNPLTVSVGKQPAWTEYMTATNKIYGDFVGSLNYWTLARSFVDGVRITGDENQAAPRLSAYIYPGSYNSAFADTSETAQNFMLQVGFDLMASRPISKRIMPSLL